jgi:hypothetical protein
MTQEATSGVERTLRAASLARVYAWGPKSGDWDQLGRWQVRWQSPWGGWPEARASGVVAAPWTTLDGARRALGGAPGQPAVWMLAPGDDADHALLVTRRGYTSGTPTADVVVLESDRAPVEARRANGEPFPDVEAAIRIGGRWYVATAQDAGEPAATIVWSIDGSTVRELARVPRVGVEPRAELRMARRSDNAGRRALGLVVDGHPDSEHASPLRWVVAIDPDSGSVSDPEPLAPVDLSDRAVSLCGGDEPIAWQVDLPYPGAVRIQASPGYESTVQSAMARMRISRERACVERILGTVDGFATTPPDAFTRVSRALGDARAIDASIFSAHIRYGLRCTSH